MTIIPPPSLPPHNDDMFDLFFGMMASDNKIIRFLGRFLTVVMIIAMVGLLAWIVWLFNDLGGIPEFLNVLKEVLNDIKEDLPW